MRVLSEVCGAAEVEGALPALCVLAYHGALLSPHHARVPQRCPPGRWGAPLPQPSPASLKRRCSASSSVRSWRFCSFAPARPRRASPSSTFCSRSCCRSTSSVSSARSSCSRACAKSRWLRAATANCFFDSAALASASRRASRSTRSCPSCALMTTSTFRRAACISRRAGCAVTVATGASLSSCRCLACTCPGVGTGAPTPALAGRRRDPRAGAVVHPPGARALGMGRDELLHLARLYSVVVPVAHRRVLRTDTGSSQLAGPQVVLLAAVASRHQCPGPTRINTLVLIL
jgi:hypothetical protein